MAILNDCGEIFYAELPACAPSFTVKLPGLLPNSEYQWYITDKFGHIYSEAVGTGEDGSFEIHASDFPDGFFNPFIGYLELEVKSNVYYCVPETFEVCGKEYSQILILFKEGNIPALIPCIC